MRTQPEQVIEDARDLVEEDADILTAQRHFEVQQLLAAQGVHANTFRYRLRRLAEVAALDLDDPVERLVVQLQLEFSGS